MMTAAYQIVLLLNKFTKLDLNYKKKVQKLLIVSVYVSLNISFPEYLPLVKFCIRLCN